MKVEYELTRHFPVSSKLPTKITRHQFLKTSDWHSNDVGFLCSKNILIIVFISVSIL